MRYPWAGRVLTSLFDSLPGPDGLLECMSVRDVALDLFLLQVTLVSFFFLASEASSRIEPTENGLL